MSRLDQRVWSAFLVAHGGGGVLAGVVTKIVPFCAFVEVAQGVEGLLPQSGWSARPEPGDRVSVRIHRIDVENRRVSLVSA